MKLIFIASAYQGKLENVMRSMMYADRLIRAGHAVFCPLLYHYMNQFRPHPEQVWKEQDMAVLLRCDGVFRDDSISEGADYEVQMAEDHFIPVYRDLDELIGIRVCPNCQTRNDHYYPDRGVWCCAFC